MSRRVLDRTFDSLFSSIDITVTYKNYPEEPVKFYDIKSLKFDNNEDNLIIENKDNMADIELLDTISKIEIILNKGD